MTRIYQQCYRCTQIRPCPASTLRNSYHGVYHIWVQPRFPTPHGSGILPLGEAITTSATEHGHIHSMVKRPHSQLRSVFMLPNECCPQLNKKLNFQRVFGFGDCEKGLWVGSDIWGISLDSIVSFLFLLLLSSVPGSPTQFPSVLGPNTNVIILTLPK